jgi:hypothetical protein
MCTLVRDQADRAAEVTRQRLAVDAYRLGRFMVQRVGGGVGEYWEDGQAMRDLRRTQAALVAKEEQMKKANKDKLKAAKDAVKDALIKRTATAASASTAAAVDGVGGLIMTTASNNGNNNMGQNSNNNSGGSGGGGGGGGGAGGTGGGNGSWGQQQQQQQQQGLVTMGSSNIGAGVGGGCFGGGKQQQQQLMNGRVGGHGLTGQESYGYGEAPLGGFAPVTTGGALSNKVARCVMSGGYMEELVVHEVEETAKARVAALKREQLHLAEVRKRQGRRRVDENRSLGAAKLTPRPTHFLPITTTTTKAPPTHNVVLSKICLSLLSSFRAVLPFLHHHQGP